MIESITGAEIAEILKKGKKSGTKKTKKKAASDWEIAQQTVENYGCPLAFHGGQVWAYHEETAWIPETTRFLAKLNRSRGRNTRSGAYEIACAQLAVPQLDQIGEPVLYWQREGGVWDGRWRPFRVQPDQLLFSDVLVDLRTGDTIPIEDAIIFGPRITVPWEGPEEESSVFSDAITFAIPESEIRRHFQEVASQILQPHVHLRGQIILYGVPHSMKSSIATAICAAPAGTFGFSTAQEVELVRDKWASIALLNKFANLSDDSPPSKRWVSWMKRYTAGTLLVEPKYHQPQSVTPTAKLISTGNEMPELADASGAAGMRVLPFEFIRPRERTWKRDQDQYMTAQYWCRPENRQAVLSWLIEGLMRVVEQGGYNPPADWGKLQKTAGTTADPVATALTELLTLTPGGFVSTQVILANLGVRLSSQRLSAYMSRIFPGAEKVKKSTRGGRCWGYSGVELA